MISKRALILAGGLLAGCGSVSVPTNLSGNLPRSGSVVPNTTFNLAPSLSVRLEKVVYWGLYAGAAYLILDPLAPNWEIEQASFPAEQYHLSLQMKRFYAGGAGEARSVFHRRAKELMRERGYDGYRVIEYSESLESSVLGSRRMAEGVVRLTRTDES